MPAPNQNSPDILKNLPSDLFIYSIY
ncbi:hypothetical protein DP144_01760 [Clostridium tetani]|nr:hypothetical protein DP154_01760 [Clostridium tetani]RYV00475.1 hypothetical protein DP144_01760 [Clostridium tetani]